MSGYSIPIAEQVIVLAFNSDALRIDIKPEQQNGLDQDGEPNIIPSQAALMANVGGTWVRIFSCPIIGGPYDEPEDAA